MEKITSKSIKGAAISDAQQECNSAHEKIDHASNPLHNLLGRWATSEGVCLEICTISDHTFSGKFYFKSLALNTIPLYGLLNRKDTYITLYSSLNLFVPESNMCREAILRGTTERTNDPANTLQIGLNCWDHEGNLNTRTFKLSKTDLLIEQVKMGKLSIGGTGLPSTSNN